MRLRSEMTGGWEWMFLEESQFHLPHQSLPRGRSPGAIAALPGLHLPLLPPGLEVCGGPGRQEREWLQAVVCPSSVPTPPAVTSCCSWTLDEKRVFTLWKLANGLSRGYLTHPQAGCSTFISTIACRSWTPGCLPPILPHVGGGSGHGEP